MKHCLTLILAFGLLCPPHLAAKEQVPSLSPKEMARIRKSAEDGDSDSQYLLGALHAKGDTMGDFSEARKWYRKAAEQGHAAAQTALGSAYALGKGMPKDHAEALKWFRKAADQGFPDAQFSLGGMYFMGEGVPKDRVEAYKWFLLASEQGSKEAGRGVKLLERDLTESQLADGRRRTRGFKRDGIAPKGNLISPKEIPQSAAEGTGSNATESMAQIRALAEKGDAEAEFILDVINASGEAEEEFRQNGDQLDAAAQAALCGVFSMGERNEDGKPFIWFRRGNHYGATEIIGNLPVFRKSAESGYVESQWALGCMYFMGYGAPKDMDEAAKWFRKAALQLHTEAQFALGSMHANGYGLPKNEAEAVIWYRESAGRGFFPAFYQLGRSYIRGAGVLKDVKEGLKWLSKAAYQGSATGQYDLGCMHLVGRDVPQDDSKAAGLFRVAADQGHPGARFALGVMYAYGRGVPKDKAEAYKWYLLASEQGNEPAKNAVRMSEHELTREQLTEGEKRTHEIKVGRVRKKDDSGLSEDITGADPRLTGSGFFITEDGYFISNEHVAATGSRVRITTSKGTIAATVVKVDKANDLALLKAAGNFTALPVTSSRTVRLGATAATVGFPNVQLQGFSPKLAKGEIASLAGIQDDARYFQISVPIQPGNSGGALVDERGNVIGVVTGKLGDEAALASTGTLAENVNYAVKSSYLLSFLESVPEVADKLRDPNAQDRKFEEIVKAVEQAAVLVLVY